jgi:hypothetical protein
MAYFACLFAGEIILNTDSGYQGVRSHGALLTPNGLKYYSIVAILPQAGDIARFLH